MTSQAFRLRLTRVNQLKLKVSARVPAQIEALTPIVLEKTNGAYTLSLDANSLSSTFATAAQGALADSAVQSVIAGSNVTVDNTDPRNPVVSASASGTGDFSSNTSSSVDGEIVLFSGTGGKTGKRATGSGLAKLTSGVLGTATSGTDYAPATSGSAILKGNGSGGFSSATAGMDYYNPGGTDVAIADGGTGQSTATAGFNALAPTTTRGDIITRGASNNQRLALGTSGYFLGSDGTDAVWQGFAQSGTGASTRTWQTKAREVLSVKDFGAVGDGTTDDSVAIANAETARAALGGELVFPPGTYKNDGTSINRANGGGWRGIGEVRFVPTANSTIFLAVSGAVVSTTDPRPFYVDNIHFDGDGYSSIIAYKEDAPYQTTLKNISITELQYAALFTGANSSTQTGWINISNVTQVGSGCWAFLGYDNTKYIFAVNISNFNQNGTAASPWTGATQLFFLRRAVSVMFDNVLAKSLDGAASGIYMLGDCQGVFINNTVIVWPTYGLRAEAWTDSLKPAYVYVTNFGVDQHTVSGADIAGRTWFISGSNFANGYARTNTGQACIIKSTSTDVAISNCLFAYDQKHGLVIETGAAKVRVNGITAENNNQAAGSNYDIDLQASTYLDVVLYGRNIVGTAGVNATGQRVVNGITSKTVSKNTGSASTTAVTTQEDLMTYAIPANTLKPGQKVRLRAWGVTAANGNTKTVRLWFGANSICDHNGAWNNLPWVLTADIEITGASTQEYSSNAFVTANALTVRQGTATNTDTSSITVKCTGQNGTANAGDITCQGFTVEILD